MKSRVVSLLSRGRAAGDDEESQTATEAEASTTEPRSTLYQCPACDAVYVAIDKTRCANCDVAVAQI